MKSALAADKAKSEFLAVMSYEIRTPPQRRARLRFDAQKHPARQRADELHRHDGEQRPGPPRLVNDILDLSKIESREIHIDATNFEMRSVRRAQVHQQLQARAYEKSLHYDFFVEYSVPKTIHCDPIRLGQILINILGNAVKFTEFGRVELLVSAKPLGLYQKNWEWTFTVKDTGPGIPQEAIPNLFQLLLPGCDSSATRRHGGSGLGLAISQRIAKLLGGDISLPASWGGHHIFRHHHRATRSTSRARPVYHPAQPLGTSGPRAGQTHPGGRG